MVYSYLVPGYYLITFLRLTAISLMCCVVVIQVSYKICLLYNMTVFGVSQSIGSFKKFIDCLVSSSLFFG